MPGFEADNHDQVNVAGPVVLGGVLDIVMYRGFEPKVGDEFVIMTFDSAEGAFDRVDGLQVSDRITLRLLQDAHALRLVAFDPDPGVETQFNGQYFELFNPDGSDLRTAAENLGPVTLSPRNDTLTVTRFGERPLDIVRTAGADVYTVELDNTLASDERFVRITAAADSGSGQDELRLAFKDIDRSSAGNVLRLGDGSAVSGIERIEFDSGMGQITLIGDEIVVDAPEGASMIDLGLGTGLVVIADRVTFKTAVRAEYMYFEVNETITLNGELFVKDGMKLSSDTPAVQVIRPAQAGQALGVDVVAAGEIRASDIARLASPDEELRIRHFDDVPGGSATGPIVIGAVGSSVPGGLFIESVATTRLSVQEIVVGSDNNAGPIAISDVAQGITFVAPLTLKSPQNGGSIRLGGTIDGVNLTVYGPGHTTTLDNNDTSMVGDILVNDSVQVAGASRLTSAQGSITIGGNLNGDGIPGADTLELSAVGGDVRVTGLTGATDALDGLRVTDAMDVVFEQAVIVEGDIVIRATGVVRFESTVHVIGGRLIVQGAEEVIFVGGVELTDDVDLGGVSGMVLDDVYRVRFVDAVVPSIGASSSAGGNLLASGGGRYEGSVVAGGSEVLRL